MKKLNFLELPDKEKKNAFTIAGQQLSIPENIIEKDFWVSWILKELFELKDLKNNLIFKGGTSLSKIYQLIKRFSEDIDLSIGKSLFGFKEDNDLFSLSNKQLKKYIEDLDEHCKKYIQDILLNQLNEVLFKKLGSKKGWKLVIEPDDRQTLLFYYPSLENYGTYIKPVVKIEMGARSEHWPATYEIITPYVSDILDERFDKMEGEIKVLTAQRTFWEKATILHAFAYCSEGKTFQERQSRHYYDFYCLLNSNIKEKAVSEIVLLKKVSEHKSYYYRSKKAYYEKAVKGTLKIIPSHVVLLEMEKDYNRMKDMLFGSYPEWVEIIEELKKFEKDFNQS